MPVPMPMKEAHNTRLLVTRSAPISRIDISDADDSGSVFSLATSGNYLVTLSCSSSCVGVARMRLADLVDAVGLLLADRNIPNPLIDPMAPERPLPP